MWSGIFLTILAILLAGLSLGLILLMIFAVIDLFFPETLEIIDEKLKNKLRGEK